nr:cryptochrome DASH, chloroplastic/mitochondrial [Ipomoea batatas]
MSAMILLTPISSTSRAAINLAQSKQPIFFFTRNFPIIMSSSRSAAVHPVPGLSWEEMERVTAEPIFQSRYSSSPSGGDIRRGKGVAIVWFRNDLRVLDNEALYKAWISSEAVLPVYCVDPRLFSTTHYFGFPKTGALRAQFIVESLADLKRNLMKRGLNLLIQHGEPEEILPSLAKTYNAHTVYAQKETCSEELNVERAVSKNLRDAIQPSSNSKNATRLELIWGCTMYHIDDLPFNCKDLPDVYTQFRKSVESKSVIRNCIKIPTSLGPSPSVAEWGSVPEVTQLGLQPEKAGSYLIY